MRIVFADTSFFVSLLNPKDELYNRACSLRKSLRPFHLLTSEMVLVELLNDFSPRSSSLRRAAVGLVEQLMRGTQSRPALATIVPQNPEQFAAAFKLYRDRPDKNWSLTDCASCLIMLSEGLDEALTHDRHFEQMGFKALLRT